MNRKQELNTFIKECITNALIRLMKKKPFDNISITELVKTAGVSRASFYRNYDNKKDILERYLQVVWYDWEKDFSYNGNPNYFIESILKHFYKNKDFNLLLYQHDLAELIYEIVRWGAKISESKNNIESYIKSMLAGSIFGTVDEWMRRGMQESPEEIFSVISKAKS